MDEKIVETVARVAHEAINHLPWELLPAREREEKIRHVGGVIGAYNAALAEAELAIAPREPTSGMKDAGDRMREHLDNEPHPFEINDSCAIYRAMIAAAPD